MKARKLASGDERDGDDDGSGDDDGDGVGDERGAISICVNLRLIM